MTVDPFEMHESFDSGEGLLVYKPMPGQPLLICPTCFTQDPNHASWFKIAISMDDLAALCGGQAETLPPCLHCGQRITRLPALDREEQAAKRAAETPFDPAELALLERFRQACETFTRKRAEEQQKKPGNGSGEKQDPKPREN